MVVVVGAEVVVVVGATVVVVGLDVVVVSGRLVVGMTVVVVGSAASAFPLPMRLPSSIPRRNSGRAARPAITMVWVLTRLGSGLVCIGLPRM